jgi:hypothetical protein
MGTAWLSTKKMPVPIVAPMPIVESWNRPMERSSSPPPVSVPVCAVSSDTGFRRSACWRSEAIPAPSGRRTTSVRIRHCAAVSARVRVSGRSQLPGADPGLTTRTRTGSR